jgi:hypothetical protein
MDVPLLIGALNVPEARREETSVASGRKRSDQRMTGRPRPASLPAMFEKSNT